MLDSQKASYWFRGKENNFHKEYELRGMRVSIKIALERLKDLLHELDSADINHIDAKLESCWVECREKERDPSITQSIIDENRKICRKYLSSLKYIKPAQ